MVEFSTTARDKAWMVMLAELAENGSIKVRDATISDENKETLKRLLKTLEEDGILVKESKYAETYYPQPEFASLCAEVYHSATLPSQ